MKTGVRNTGYEVRGQAGKASFPVVVLVALSLVPVHRTPVVAAGQADADRMVRALDDIDEMLRALEDELVARRKELHRAQAALRVAEIEIQIETERALSKKAELEANMKALYTFGQAGYVAMLFTSASLMDTLKRDDYLARITGYNRAQLEAYVRKVGEIQQRREDLERRRKRAADDEAYVRSKIKAAVDKRAERLAIVARVRNDPNLRAVMARETARRAQKFEETVGAAGGAGAGTGAFAGKKGALPWPAHGVVEAGFGVGDDEIFGVKKQRKGWDIRARFLSEVRAVADGRVVHVGWMRGYGNVLVVDHGDGYLTINAHLARADRAVGDEVKSGEVVAYVGDTASNKGPFLYFEIRRRGKPLDPAEWLTRR